MASAEQIREILHESNRKLKDELSKELMDQVGKIVNSTITSRLAEHGDKIFKELRALQLRGQKLLRERVEMMLWGMCQNVLAPPLLNLAQLRISYVQC